jgi:hypothetical protein
MKTKMIILGTLSAMYLSAGVALAQDAEAEFVVEDISGPRSKPAPGVGMEPSDLAIKGYGTDPVGGGGDGDGLSLGKSNAFYFKGYLRAPFNVGFGTAQTQSERVDGTGPDALKLHAPPQIPDTSYLDWRTTNTHGGPWTEIRFIYGNETVSANVSIASYNATAGGYKALAAQLGIDQAFVNMSFPGLFGDIGGLVANVGVFSGRYGAAGRYAADMYDTYLVGTTNIAGESVRVYFDVAPRWTLHIEQGFGGKTEVAPFISDELQNDTGGPAVADGYVPNPVVQPYLVYGGPAEQGSTIVHHEHIGVSYMDQLTIAGHLMHEFTAEAVPGAANGADEDGKLVNIAVDIRLRDFFFGDAYLGYSHMILENADRLGGGIEALHSIEGWSYNKNYLEGSRSGGTIDSIMWQYELSLAKALWHPKEFWGQDRDLEIKIFGMFNHVTPETPDTFISSENRLKWGADLMYTPVKFMGVGARFDAVYVDLDNNNKSFNQISPRIMFRTDFLSHEEITLQYSRYFYGDEVDAGYPWDCVTGTCMAPDENVLTIMASMWW